MKKISTLYKKDLNNLALVINERNPENDMEGIMFHHPNGRMCKIRKSDFGIKR